MPACGRLCGWHYDNAKRSFRSILRMGALEFDASWVISVGELLILGFGIGFTVSTCVYMMGWTIAQVRRFIRSVR